MNIVVIDSQGGGIGRQVVSSIRAAFPDENITAIGTNAQATAAMLKAGASHVPQEKIQSLSHLEMLM